MSSMRRQVGCRQKGDISERASVTSRARPTDRPTERTEPSRSLGAADGARRGADRRRRTPPAGKRPAPRRAGSRDSPTALLPLREQLARVGTGTDRSGPRGGRAPGGHRPPARRGQSPGRRTPLSAPTARPRREDRRAARAGRTRRYLEAGHPGLAARVDALARHTAGLRRPTDGRPAPDRMTSRHGGITRTTTERLPADAGGRRRSVLVRRLRRLRRRQRRRDVLQ